VAAASLGATDTASSTGTTSGTVPINQVSVLGVSDPTKFLGGTGTTATGSTSSVTDTTAQPVPTLTSSLTQALAGASLAVDLTNIEGVVAGHGNATNHPGVGLGTPPDHPGQGNSGYVNAEHSKPDLKTLLPPHKSEG